MPAPEVRQRVILYGGVRLGVDLLALLGEERAVNVISAPLELARDGSPADVVVVDVPAEDRRSVCEEVRYYYRGPLIVLLHPGDNSHDLPPDRSRTLLSRPFSMHELAVALAAAGSASTASDPAGRPRLLPSHGAQDRGANAGLNKGRTRRPPAGAKLQGASPGPDVGDPGRGRPGLHRRFRAGQPARPLPTTL